MNIAEDSAGDIMLYVCRKMPANYEYGYEADSRTWLYDHLEKFGWFENKEIDFKNEVIGIFDRCMEHAIEDPTLGDLQDVYISGIFSEIEEWGRSLDCDPQEIFETQTLYHEKNSELIEDKIKIALDEQGLSPLYFTAPEDNYALIKQYFGAQNFFPDILNHLVRRRVH